MRLIVLAGMVILGIGIYLIIGREDGDGDVLSYETEAVSGFADQVFVGPQQRVGPSEYEVERFEVVYESVSTEAILATLAPTVAPTLSPTSEPEVEITATEVADPTSTPDVWAPAHLVSLFERYANEYGVDQNTLERIANCESHFNPDASNGDYLGMFQFSSGTWRSQRRAMGLPEDSSLRTNVEESIKTAAFLVSRAGTSPWPSCLR